LLGCHDDEGRGFIDPRRGDPDTVGILERRQIVRDERPDRIRGGVMVCLAALTASLASAGPRPKGAPPAVRMARRG
jgi:hypothetical protein